MNPLQIKPNIPLTVALVDPEGHYDPDSETVSYQTTNGQSLTLPHRAAVALNLLEPQPGEELVITRIWSGKRAEQSEWTVALSPTSEKCRAKAEKEPADLTGLLEMSIDQAQARKGARAHPTPIRKGPRRALVGQPEGPVRLFDRGTGTHGPSPAIQPEDVPRSIPLPAVAIGRGRAQGQIPANIAIKEILAFVNADPGTANWSGDTKQDLCATILIASFKAGYIGLWQRDEK